MCFDSKGDNIFSVGSDNVLKKGQYYDRQSRQKGKLKLTV